MTSYPVAHRKKIAVIGSGISGLSAAWLLSQRHDVTLFESDNRLGGHSNTVDVDGIAVDTGFIVYNEATYPNLTALFRHIGVATKPTEMSFSVSFDGGRLEYSGSGLGGLLAQPANAVRPRFWSMLSDLRRFYINAPGDLARLGDMSLEDYLTAENYGTAFREDHLYPMAAAIWSTPAMQVGSYPAASFIRFFVNHGLLKFSGRPQWRTVEGGSRAYVEKLAQPFAEGIQRGRRIDTVRRAPNWVELTDLWGRVEIFDDVVIACHADDALAMLADPGSDERRLLGAFRYIRNEAVLHRDATLMPRRRRAWSSWNYVTGAGQSTSSAETNRVSVSYWMNRLQGLPGDMLFVTLNPIAQPRPDLVRRRESYSHPCYDAGAMAAQRDLWSLQGKRRTWFCGAYFGAGFHEDGLQSGLAVAEALGGVRRPWQVEDESGRIKVGDMAISASDRELVS